LNSAGTIGFEARLNARSLKRGENSARHSLAVPLAAACYYTVWLRDSEGSDNPGFLLAGR